MMMHEPPKRSQLVPQVPCRVCTYHRVHRPILNLTEKQGVPKQSVKCLDQVNLLFFFPYFLIIVDPYPLAYLITSAGMSVILRVSSFPVESERWRQHESSLSHYYLLLRSCGYVTMSALLPAARHTTEDGCLAECA